MRKYIVLVAKDHEEIMDNDFTAMIFEERDEAISCANEYVNKVCHVSINEVYTFAIAEIKWNV